MITADTNVFIYAAQIGNSAKRETAATVLERLASTRGPVCLQVIGEFQNAARRKLALSAQQRADYGRDMLLAYDTFAPTRSAVDAAIGLYASGELSYWDALLVASAREAGCTVLISEDMGNGRVHLGVRVISPFEENGALSLRVREVLDL